MTSCSPCLMWRAQVRQHLDQHGIPYELLEIEVEVHGIAKIANQKVLESRLVEFLLLLFLPDY